MKLKKIGVECGADLSCFSSFKLQGPEGIGIVVGKEEYVNRIRKMHYSGGCQTQGHEALDVLRGLTYAPVMLAITAKEVEKTLSKLQNGEIPEIKDAFIANAQSKVLLVELSEPMPGSQLDKHLHDPNFCDHHDHFTNSTPESEWKSCLEHAQKIGLGNREYELVEMK